MIYVKQDVPDGIGEFDHFKSKSDLYVETAPNSAP